MSPFIEAEGLIKRFGETVALDGLDLTARSGEVLAILGPNGAGKTTFVRMLATLLKPDAGRLRVAGVDVLNQPAEVRRRIGLAGQFAAVDAAQSGRENLQMVARLFGHTRRDARAAADTVLEQLGLSDAGDRLVRTYSGGMRRRLDLGASLVGAPKLLLLDEPTTGLDPRSRAELWAAIEALVADGTDVLLTTQYLEEADRLAGRIAIVDRGAVVAEGTPDELKDRAGADVIELRLRNPSDRSRAIETLNPHATIDDEHPDRLSVPASDGADDAVAAIRRLDDAGLHLAEISLRRPTLDDVFLALTGHSTAITDTASEEQAA
jgi:ABC-2 type transport system ATP-binding protein